MLGFSEKIFLMSKVSHSYSFSLIQGNFGQRHIKGVKKNSPVTFLVAEGVIIIAQQCYTPRWKRLGTSFQVITEPFLCDQYFPRYR